MKKGGVIHDYIKKMKNIQKHILQFLDDDSNQEENYQILISYIIDLKIIDNKKEIKEILNLILHISNNYHHSPIFFSQIDRILAFFKNEIQDCFSNFDLFHFFRKNKRILLFLFEEKLLIPDRTIYRYILNNDKYKRRNYLQYFYPEFKTFFSQKTIPRLCKDDNELFKQKRKAGENDKYICNLIRNDDVDEFVTYVNRTNLPLSTVIEQSIFETNQFLYDKNPTLIEYAAFFGSIQIFKYLYFLNIELTPSLWLYLIHGKNPELIHLIEEHIQPKNDPDPELVHLLEKLSNIQPNVFYNECLIESIKCHHNEIANYFIINFIQNQDDDDDDVYSNIYAKSIKYNNYEFFPKNLNSELVFYNLCKYYYLTLVEFLLEMTHIDINSLVI